MKRSLAPRWRFGHVCLAASAFLALAATSARATIADDCVDICGSGTGDCSVHAAWEIVPGSEIDCSGRNITVSNLGTIKVIGGAFTLLANNLTVTGPSGTITGLEDSEETPGEINLELTGDLNLHGKLRANGPNSGGVIRVSAAGDITIPESGTDGVEADGTGPGADGGSIFMEAAGFISISDPVHAAGAGSNGSSGGSVEIRAQGDVTTGVEGHVSAEGLEGGGGSVSIVSVTGNVTIGEHVDVEGRRGTGDGGAIHISAGGSVVLQEQITARGGVSTIGGDAHGGSIDIAAGCGGIILSANILANGGTQGQSDSGQVQMEADGSITVQAGVVIDARALSPAGQGGVIELSAGDGAVLASNATLDARGGAGSAGLGGRVRLSGCTVQLGSASKLDVTAYRGGALNLEARKEGPSEGAQPLRVATGAILKAVGSTTALNGVTTLAALFRRSGTCSNHDHDPAFPCTFDVDCTAGCETGSCDYANPDTDGVGSQFDVAPSRLAASYLGACSSSCSP